MYIIYMYMKYIVNLFVHAIVWLYVDTHVDVLCEPPD